MCYYGFKNNKLIKHVIFDDQMMVDIWDQAFFGCSNLVDVTFKCKTMGMIGKQSFMYTAITTITIPSSTMINHLAFNNCKKLGSAHILRAPIICVDIFHECRELKEVSFCEEMKTQQQIQMTQVIITKQEFKFSRMETI